MRLAVTLERWATLCVRSAVGFDVCVQHSMNVEDDNEQRLRLNMHCRRQYVRNGSRDTLAYLWSWAGGVGLCSCTFITEDIMSQKKLLSTWAWRPAVIVHSSVHRYIRCTVTVLALRLKTQSISSMSHSYIGYHLRY